MKKVLACASFVFLLPATGLAVPTVYTYTGQDYTTVDPAAGAYQLDMSVSGSITLADALPASTNASVDPAGILAFSFNDGRVNYTLANAASSAAFSFETDASGSVIGWNNVLSRTGLPFGATSSLVSQSACAAGGVSACDFVQVVSPIGIASASATVPGAWTAAPIPEPSAYALMLAGLALVGFAAKRRMRLPS